MIQNTINTIFDHSREIFPEINHRQPRQMSAAITGGVIVFLTNNLLSGFSGNNHKVESEFSKNLIVNLCYLKHREAIEDQILLELISQNEILQNELTNLRSGTIINTKIKNIFLQYCADINTPPEYEILVKNTKKVFCRNSIYIY
mgnify:CR=1 FL=1